MYARKWVRLGSRVFAVISRLTFPVRRNDRVKIYEVKRKKKTFSSNCVQNLIHNRVSQHSILRNFVQALIGEVIGAVSHVLQKEEEEEEKNTCIVNLNEINNQAVG